MKPFAVLRLDAERLIDFGYLDNRRLLRHPQNLNGMAYRQSVHSVKRVTDDHINDPDWPVYFTDTEPDANQLATQLAKDRPGVQYVVVKACSAFAATATEPTKSVFTDKGLVPA